MSDPVNSARTARERLAQGLAALQSPGVPTALLGVAEPIAQAMSGLHQIEATHGAARAHAAPGALDAVRRALGALQQDVSGHPAVVQAIEAVAGSLGLVHALTTPAPAQAPPAAAQWPAAQPAHPHHPQAQAAPSRAAAQQRGADAFAGTMVAGHAPPATMPAAPPAAVQAPAPQVQWAQPPAMQPPPVMQAPAMQAPAMPAQRPAQPAAVQHAVGPGGAIRVAAELGVHSVTNFYKGLSGNDIIDSGGIFIATYQIPPIGRELVIHVTMPGGYEFEAKGVVRWTREAPLSGAAGLDAPPGFGAQFLDITQEARQLVYRYVRNREPLFHDDL